jgi:hypothetical protein
MPAPPPARAAAFSAQVTVSGTPLVRPIPPGFLGLALEYNTITRWFGQGASTGDPVLVRLMRNLDPSGHAVLRVGGLSTDRVWWPVPGMPKPIGITFSLTPAWAASARALAQATGTRLMLGLNLQANRSRIDQVEAAHLVGLIGRSRIAALQIGNEPDLYTTIPWFKRLHGRDVPWYDPKGTPVYARRASYGPAQFAAEVRRTLTVLPNVPIAGPETGKPAWLGAFAGAVGGRIAGVTLTSHLYPLTECEHYPPARDYPSVPHMLAWSASRDFGASPGFVDLAHRHGGRYRLDEMGSISCNGQAGVSDTMASALWVLDALFHQADSYIDGVNLHTYPGSVNGLFDLRRTRAGWRAAVHPLYYGALMFAQAAPAGARLVAVSGAPGPAALRVWATRGPDHHVRVVVLNDDLGAAAHVTVGAPPGFGARPGSVERLSAPSAYATGAVTLGGRRFGAATATGALAPPLLQSVRPRAGVFALTLPPGSAALLTLPGVPAAYSARRAARS